ncbi:MAG: ion channel [Robiginitalea sp.]|nr:ion channel [Robiginitalea sp.]
MKTLRKYRFELYLITFCLLLFGSLFFPADIFLTYVDPLLILFNIIAGFVLISMRSKTRRIYAVLFGIVLIFDLVRVSQAVSENVDYQLIRLGLLSLFYTIVTVEIILQVWHAREVTKNVIFGVMGGYVSLGLVAFFLLLGIHIAEPDSFRGLEVVQGEGLAQTLIYYAYITLMTIGYGDIVPVKPLAQKAAVFIGLLGQFYLVIITATVVGKYIGGQQQRP